MLTRVLLVEDEDDAREILAFYLNTVFDEVEVAVNGEDGIQKFQNAYSMNKTFDLVLTDIKMPKKDGLEMMEEITAINNNQKFIIVSAYKDEEYLFKSINLNVISYFLKPLEVQNIMDILKQVKNKVLEDKEKIKNEWIYLNRTYRFNIYRDMLYKGDEIIDLSNKEMVLLKALLNNKETIKTKDELKLAIWNDVNTSDVTLRTVIKRLKDKIKEEDFIVSKKGRGYIITS
jgi:DNA-binding response OmpR family regulator